MKILDSRALRTPAIVDAVAVAVQRGATVIFPTDTVYGIGCDPLRPSAVQRIFALKNRPRSKPLSLHFASVAELLEYAAGNALAAAAARAFLPGPLTLIVRRPAFVDERVTAGLPSVGLRVPRHDLCRLILERCGPLAATSANMSGAPAYTGEEGLPPLPAADIRIDDGPTPIGIESSIVDVSGERPRIVREGAISIAMLEEVLGRIDRRLGRATCTALVVAALGTTLAGAAPQGAPSGYALTHVAGFDHISTDRFNYNLNTGEFSIPGHFSATRQGTDITADRANGNSKQKMMHAEGHVVVHQTQELAAGGKTTDLTQRPSTLLSDRLDVDGTRKRYTATGNMHFTQEGGREAFADNAVLDDADHHLHMEGHVHVKNGEQTIDANILDYDTLSGQLDGQGNVTITSPLETAPPRTAPSGRPKKRKLPF